MPVRFRKIGLDEGLSSYNIKKIVEDKNSFIWMASQDGLNKFDSKKVIQYKQGKGIYNISGNDVWDLQIDSVNNLIWVASNNSVDAIDLVSGQVIVRVSIEAINASSTQILLSENIIWIATNRGLMTYDFKKKAFQKNILDGIFADLNINSIVKDHSNRLWCYSSDYGFVVVDMGTKKTLNSLPNKYLQFTRSPDFRLQNRLLTLDDNRVLFGSYEGFKTLSIEGDSLHCNFGFDKIVVNEPIMSFDLDNNKNVWYATAKGLYKYRVSSGETIQIKDVDQNKYQASLVQDIYFGTNNTIWISTINGVEFTSTIPSPFQTFFRSADLHHTIDHAYYVFPDTLDNVFLCTGNGFYKFNTQSGDIKIIDSTGFYFFCFRGPENTLIVSRSDRLFYLNDNLILKPIENIFKEILPVSLKSLNSCVTVNDTLLLMGSESNEGVYKWNVKRRTFSRKNSQTKPYSLSSDIVNTVNKVASDCFILSDHLATKWSLKSDSIMEIILKDAETSEPVSFYFDIVKIRDQYYTAIYGKGVYKTDSNFSTIEILSEKNGLCNNGVYRLFSVGDSQLVITTNRGLSVYDLSKRKFKNYFLSDGIHSNAFEEGCAFQKNSLIYAGGVNGFTIIDPSKFTTNTIPPRVYINRIVIDRSNKSKNIDTTNLQLRELDVPNDVLQVTLHFSGINYSNPERTAFAYRIMENNEDWVKIGAQNYINIIGLSHGTYHIEVKAANEDDVWSLPVTLTLVYLPKWYETWWLKTLLVLAAIGIGFAIYKVRINQILRQQKIRKDVASDLHDDIGSSLNSVKVFAHLAKSNPSRQEYITNIEENLDQATIGLRDMIWILDDKQDTISDLCNRLSQQSAKSAEAIGIEVHFEIAEGLDYSVLSKPAKRNLFLIAKECINNSVKYSSCTNLWITVKSESKRLRLTIKDDGRGFDSSKTTEGYGLKNIRSRAAQINFNCVINSSAEGTEITIAEK